ncbi:N amino acid transport system protein [Aspergillus awamori]|uniref:N amino acid transport system protein n=1 Tax=Aspergillus awamori TaxID=105351 RepID=A0A401KSU0_ASPAW|nr:N amino acid transport system protein [Aspergillus awamori]
MPVTFEVLTIPVMIAETISLRILAFPKVLATLGLLPGIAVIIGVGVLTTYTGLVIGDFKCRYPQAHSMADAGTILWGRIGCEILGAAQLIFFVFIMGSHILTFSVMMSVLTGYSGCTVLFSVAGGLPSNVFTIPRRLESLSFLSSVSFASVLGAVFASMSIISIANIVFAYAGHVAFFTFFSELRGVRDYPRALALLRVSEVTLYMVTAIVIHVLVGNDVASPSLNSVSPIFKKISYGIAIQTVGGPSKGVLLCRPADRISQIVIAGAVNAHVAMKSIYLRMFHSRNAMHSRPLGAISLWAVVCVTLWFLAWVVSESTPVFNDILGLAMTPVLQSSFLASWFIFNLPGVFWLYLNVHGKPLSWKQIILIGFNCIIVTIGVVMCIFGGILIYQIN